MGKRYEGGIGEGRVRGWHRVEGYEGGIGGIPEDNMTSFSSVIVWLTASDFLIDDVHRCQCFQCLCISHDKIWEFTFPTPISSPRRANLNFVLICIRKVVASFCHPRKVTPFLTIGSGYWEASARSHLCSISFPTRNAWRLHTSQYVNLMRGDTIVFCSIDLLDSPHCPLPLTPHHRSLHQKEAEPGMRAD